MSSDYRPVCPQCRVPGGAHLGDCPILGEVWQLKRQIDQLTMLNEMLYESLKIKELRVEELEGS